MQLRPYLQQYAKDLKYYTGQSWTVPELYNTVLNDYEEFLKLNEGFVKVSKAGDLKLPAGVKSIADEASILGMIENVVETGNFKPMLENYSVVK